MWCSTDVCPLLCNDQQAPSEGGVDVAGGGQHAAAMRDESGEADKTMTDAAAAEVAEEAAKSGDDDAEGQAANVNAVRSTEKFFSNKRWALASLETHILSLDDYRETVWLRSQLEDTIRKKNGKRYAELVEVGRQKLAAMGERINAFKLKQRCSQRLHDLDKAMVRSQAFLKRFSALDIEENRIMLRLTSIQAKRRECHDKLNGEMQSITQVLEDKVFDPENFGDDPHSEWTSDEELVAGSAPSELPPTNSKAPRDRRPVL